MIILTTDSLPGCLTNITINITKFEPSIIQLDGCFVKLINEQGHFPIEFASEDQARFARDNIAKLYWNYTGTKESEG